MKTMEIKTILKKENIVYRKVIKEKCLECLCDQHMDCEMPDCSLYLFMPYQKDRAKTVLKK
jgi:hypothetical protein